MSKVVQNAFKVELCHYRPDATLAKHSIHMFNCCPGTLFSFLILVKRGEDAEYVIATLQSRTLIRFRGFFVYTNDYSNDRFTLLEVSLVKVSLVKYFFYSSNIQLWTLLGSEIHIS